MRKPTITLIAAAAWMCIGSPLCSYATSPTFEQNYAKAKANAATSAGAAYDQQLGTVTQSLPGFLPSMHDCVAKNSSRSSVHDYYEFTSATHYRVVLQPKGPFADCISGVLENRTLPPPPQTPYLDPFDFNLTP